MLYQARTQNEQATSGGNVGIDEEWGWMGVCGFLEMFVIVLMMATKMKIGEIGEIVRNAVVARRSQLRFQKAAFVIGIG
ncbi:hypothetical protein [Pseudomonas koreensis]|uniref:hypothetical protein n=1 Tax=Pseudomonas koreensis TaxID=198620 RepID=UPI0037F22CAA